MPNITSDPETGIGKLTDAEIVVGWRSQSDEFDYRPANADPIQARLRGVPPTARIFVFAFEFPPNFL